MSINTTILKYGGSEIKVNPIDNLLNLNEKEYTELAIGPQETFLESLEQVNYSLRHYHVPEINTYNNWSWKKGDYDKMRHFIHNKLDLNKKPKNMATLLDINIAPTTTNFIPHSSSYWDCTNWDTNRNDCFEESPVDDIFISDYSEFTKYCLFEINFNELDGKTVRDSSGNGNKAILFGDYSIKKKNINKKAIRDSYIKVPKLGRKNGAI